MPGGAQASFALAFEELAGGFARVGIIKDAGVDPDVTHGARSAGKILELARAEGFDIAAPVAKAAWRTAAMGLRDSAILLEITVFDRAGQLLARMPFLPVHEDLLRNRR